VATTLLCCHNLTNCSPSYNPLEENCKTVSQIFQSFSLNSATWKCNICNNFATSFGFQTCYIVLPISRTLQPWTRILMIVNSFKPNTVCVLANFDRPVFLSVKNTSSSWTNLLFRLVESYWGISCWPVLEVALATWCQAHRPPDWHIRRITLIHRETSSKLSPTPLHNSIRYRWNKNFFDCCKPLDRCISESDAAFLRGTVFDEHGLHHPTCHCEVACCDHAILLRNTVHSAEVG